MGEGAAEQDDKTGKAQGQREGQRRLAQWVRDYSRLPGTPDEFLGPDGAPRAVWSRFFDAFGALAPDEIERRFGMADRHLRDIHFVIAEDRADHADDARAVVMCKHQHVAVEIGFKPELA